MFTCLEPATTLKLDFDRAIHVLHVDGNAAFVNVAEHFLKTYGNFEITTANSVEEATEKMQQEAFDVIVFGYEMPGKNGLDFLKRLKTDSNSVPFILFTGRGSEEIAMRALNLGAFRYLNKHGDPKIVYKGLSFFIKQAFEHKRIQDERSKYEKLLLENQQKFSALFSENFEAVVFCDKDSCVVDANSSFTELFGYTADEVKGRDLKSLIVPEDLREEADLIEQRLLEGRVECSTVRQRKDGFPVNVSLSGAPIVTEGRVVGNVTIYRDITDVIFASEELNKILEEQNKMLKNTALLNEKLSVTGSLTRHDVQNKLAAISGYTHMLKKRLSSNSSDNVELQRYVLEIEKVTKNIVEILDFARTYEMLGNQERVKVNVGKMVADAASLFSDLKGVIIINECGGFEVLADSLLMEVFHNLIDNSLKYGEKIRQIKIYTQKNPDNTTSLIYEDDGVGIDADMKSTLFRKGVGKGTGYGLYLIKRICEIYGWTIQENGKAGEGVQFVIRIPAALCDGNAESVQ